MRFFSYVVSQDSGFAPNPFYGYCTLAVCKPKIRVAAEPEDWVVGLSSRGEHVVYVMKVENKLDFDAYWHDSRFHCKRPSQDTPIHRCGDNIYEPLGNGMFRQLPSWHSKPRFGNEDPDTQKRDLSGRFVLIATDFVYFGANGPKIQPDLEFIRVGRGHRCHFTPVELQKLEAWANGMTLDTHGKPLGKVSDPSCWNQTDHCGCG